MSGKFDLGDYVTVPERMAAFFAAFPEGSLQSKIIRQEDLPEGFIGVQAFAYRHPEDRLPGIGHAYEVFPGRTPYTKDSELQNAETSAWGRAIAAVLPGAATKGIATREDVVSRASAEGACANCAGTFFSPQANGFESCDNCGLARKAGA